MSDNKEAPKITSDKPKDPRRVEAGKRLAAISRQAKERKKMKMAESEEKDSGSPNSSYLIAGIGILVGAASLYFSYKDDKSEGARVMETKNEEKTVKIERSFDSLE